jgi:hypothetical protein
MKKITLPDNETRNILFSQIDWTETTCLISYGRPIRPLILSIEAIGLQHPPIVQEDETGRFRPVSGYRRLLALQKTGREPFRCRVVSSSLGPRDLFLYNFFDNLDRGFNPVEQALVLKRLSGFIEEGQLIREYLPLLNLPPKKEVYRNYLKTAELSPLYLPALVQGRLFPEIVSRVMREFPSLAHLLFPLFLFLHWGFQKQKEFLSDLKEISLRLSRSPEELFFSATVFALLERSTATSPQKGEALREFFRRCLFPALTETERTFKEKVSALDLDRRTRIIPPAYFEGGQYSLEIRFSGGGELQESLLRISRALEGGSLDDLP